jgi:hypothetical protein
MFASLYTNTNFTVSFFSKKRILVSNNAENYQQQETQLVNTTLRSITGDIDLLYDLLFCRVTMMLK